MKHYYPGFDEFMALAERGNTIPVYRQLLADALTPVMAYQRLAQPAEGESAEALRPKTPSCSRASSAASGSRGFLSRRPTRRPRWWRGGTR